MRQTQRVYGVHNGQRILMVNIWHLCVYIRLY